MATKFLFTLVFDGDYSMPGTIKFDGKILDNIRNDAAANAKAVKERDPNPLDRLEQLAFYQDPDPIPTRVVLTGVADFKDLHTLVQGKPVLLDQDSNPVKVDDDTGKPTMAKVVGDFFEPLVKALVDDHTAKIFGLRRKQVPQIIAYPKFTWVVVSLEELDNGSGTLHSKGMEGISGGGKKTT